MALVILLSLNLEVFSQKGYTNMWLFSNFKTNFSKDEFSASLLNCIAESLTVFSQTTLKCSSSQSRCRDLTRNKTLNHVIIQPNWCVVLNETKREYSSWVYLLKCCLVSFNSLLFNAVHPLKHLATICFKIYSHDVLLFHPLQEFQTVPDLPEETKII